MSLNAPESLNPQNRHKFFKDYNIKAESVGGGKFGRIYKATSTREIDKGDTYALKVLRDSIFGDDDRNKRFEREWGMLFLLPRKYANDIRIPHGIESDQENFCFMMTWIEGTTLANIFKDHEKPSSMTIKHFLEDVLETLGKIHSSNIIHRDLQPNNLMRSDKGKFFIIDFGMAVYKSEINPQKSTLAMDHKKMKGYAPESHKSSELCDASDIYSIGAIAISWLSNIQLYEPDKTDSLVLHEEWKKSLQEAWNNYYQNPQNQVHQELGDILSKMVAPDLDKRYKTCQDVLDALEQIPPEELEPSKPKPKWQGFLTTRPAENPDKTLY